MKRLSVLLFGALGIFSLTGCGGGTSGANGSDPFNGGGDTPPVVALELNILNSQCQDVVTASFDADESLCVRATLTSDNAALNNEVVNFTTVSQLGDLSTSTALTNSSGIAEVRITNPNLQIGATTLTATYGELTDTASYEYISLPFTEDPNPQLDINIYKNGVPVSRFKAGEEVQLQAKLLNSNNEPVMDSIVSFSVSGNGPTLTPDSGLTNANGITQVTLATTTTDLGAFTAQANVTVNNLSISDAINFEIQAADTIVDEGETLFGYINNNGQFVEGSIGSTAENSDGNVIISAGATAGFSVALVNETGQRIQTPTPVSFTSNCVSSGQATIDAIVTTINGVASATYEDISCAGSTGNSDQVIASVVINNTTFTINRALTIQPEGIGSISFISASPSEIVLQGTGGQNSQSISTLTFQVNGELGNPLAQQEVDFALNTSTGGLSIEPLSGLTNSQGQVSTRVSAGNVPTAVRVTASTQGVDGEVIRTQSDLLSVNTGLPDQNSFSLSSSLLNAEAFNVDGVQATIVARLADSFNNPVPNGTTVSFTTEGGTIQPSCITGEDANGNVDPDSPNTGTCSVVWTSSNPRPSDHRITILATAIGHETLIDSNGNNIFDDNDGGPIPDGNDNGLAVSTPDQTGFVDHSEAWRDDNENGIKDPSELFIDYNSDLTFNEADGLFNGPQCQSSTLCGQGEGTTLHVRKSLVLVMSSSAAYWRVYNGDISNINNVVFDNDPNISSPNSLTLANGQTSDLTLVYYDTAGQVLPSGTEVGIINNQTGNVELIIDRVSNSTRPEDLSVPGSTTDLDNITNTAEGEVQYNYRIQTPRGNQTEVSFKVILAP